VGDYGRLGEHDMRLHKKVWVRRKRFGVWWQAYGVADKIVKLAKQTDSGIDIGDTISRLDEGTGKLITAVVEHIIYITAERIKHYTFDLLGKVYITPARGWKKTIIQELPLELALKINPDVKWKGEWRVREASLHYTVEPHRLVSR